MVKTLAKGTKTVKFKILVIMDGNYSDNLNVITLSILYTYASRGQYNVVGPTINKT